MFRIRIDIINDLNSDEILEVVKPDTYVIVRHELPHGNPHYHAYIKYNSHIKDNTIRQRIKRNFTQLKSSDYSVKKCDEDRVNEYVQYLFNTKHGNKWELIDTNNFDNKLLDDLIQAAKEISDDFTERNKSKKNTGPTIWELAEEISAVIDKLDLTTDNKQTNYDAYCEEKYRYEVYTDTAIDIMRKHKKPYCEFLLRKLITTAMTSSEKGRQVMRQKMTKYFLN